MTLPDVRGKRVLVYSLGIEGRDLAAFFLARGASVTMSDTRSDEALAAAQAVAPGGVARVVNGGPLLDPAGFDLVAPAQAILRHDPAILRARELGIPILSTMQIFLQACPGRTIGITGSSGKTTTTALVAHIAAQAGRRSVVGGNIGRSMLGALDEIDRDTLVILEISHTQLQYTDRSPSIAAITNVTPNHLDQFEWEAYVDLKRQILAHQGPGDIAVLNHDDPVSQQLVSDVRGQLHQSAPSGAAIQQGAKLAGTDIVRVTDGQEHVVLSRGTIRLPGEHNVANVVMATAIAAAAGIEDAAIANAVASFTGVAHRLQPVGTAGGARYINDSIATAPERTVAGLNAFTQPVVLLLGGRDKNLPVDTLRNTVRERCRAVVSFGESGPFFHEEVGTAAPQATLVGTLAEAVEAAARLAQPGDVVLLAPGGTSFDAFPRFEARGDAFVDLVHALPGFEPEEATHV